MRISAKKLGKRYAKTWVFKDIDIEIESLDHFAITGSNGSGKSTLLKILSGYLSPTDGYVEHDTKKISADDFNFLSYTAPYVEIPEEMDMNEFLNFHSTFRERKFSNVEICHLARLPINKRIGDFSTGMKQRAQLCTAFYFKNNAVFMDEPTSNLDEQGFNWWMEEFKKLSNVTVLLASNSKDEINVCKKRISL